MRIQLALGLSAALAVASHAPASAQLTVVQPGFSVKTLPQGIGAKQIECSPGGAWGNYVYIACTYGNVIERVDPADNVSVFATGLFTPISLEFGPGPAGNFGNYIYVSEWFGSAIAKVDTSGGVSSFVPSITLPGDLSFDPSGAYGTNLFVASNAFTGPIVTLPPAGGPPTGFSLAGAAYLKFGPGGAWGTGMYASTSPALVKIDSAGVATPFATGFTTAEGFDWAFGGDLFAVDISADSIFRVDSTGSKTLWATLPGAADVAYCNGALYAVSALGGCYKVTEMAGGNYCTPGTTASGCQATLSTSGTASATAASGFSLMAATVEGNKDGLFFFGANGKQANSWGNGTSFQCVVPPVKRGGLLSASGTNGNCNGAFSQDLNALWNGAPAKNPGAGATVQAQLWFRDPVNTSNQTTSLSDAVEFSVGP